MKQELSRPVVAGVPKGIGQGYSGTCQGRLGRGNFRGIYWGIWVCLKMLCTPKPNGFADHYPVFKWLFHWEYTQHFQTNPYVCLFVSRRYPFSQIRKLIHVCVGEVV